MRHGPYRTVKTRIVERFGDGILDDLERLRTQPFFTLIGVAKKHGVTRERIRQIYNSFYHRKTYRKYGKEVLSKRLKVKEDCALLDSVHCTAAQKIADHKMGLYNAPGFKGEYRFIKECQRRGFNIEYTDCGRRVDFEVNGYCDL